MEYLVQFHRNGKFRAFKFTGTDAANAAQRFHDWVQTLSNVRDVWCGPC